MDSFFEQTKVVAAFKKEWPYILDIQRLVKEIGYGKLVLALTIQDGRVLSLEVNSKQLVRYDRNERLFDDNGKKRL